jgi:hypothetical protein
VSRRAKPSPALPGQADLNLYIVVLIDVVGSASRDHQGQRQMRDDLYGLVDKVAAANGLDLDRLPYDDNGDGLRLVVAPHLLAPTRVIDAFVSGLAAGLREHRRSARPEARLRLRVSFDLGLVEAHRRGRTGEVLVRATRLVNADAAREALRADPDADLVAVVSDAMYQLIERHRLGQIPPSSYRRIRVNVKEFVGRAWLLVPGSLTRDP